MDADAGLSAADLEGRRAGLPLEAGNLKSAKTINKFLKARWGSRIEPM